MEYNNLCMYFLTNQRIHAANSYACKDVLHSYVNFYNFICSKTFIFVYIYLHTNEFNYKLYLHFHIPMYVNTQYVYFTGRYSNSHLHVHLLHSRRGMICFILSFKPNLSCHAALGVHQHLCVLWCLSCCCYGDLGRFLSPI